MDIHPPACNPARFRHQFTRKNTINQIRPSQTCRTPLPQAVQCASAIRRGPSSARRQPGNRKIIDKLTPNGAVPHQDMLSQGMDMIRKKLPGG